ncbi:hypothetical protein [Streptomyces sp. NPDC050507]|uniref:hypothetical protein n=1 Tax=Streptomyces sp. NPDC050507 TaxID=3365619 RepID=UPI0037ABE449
MPVPWNVKTARLLDGICTVGPWLRVSRQPVIVRGILRDLLGRADEAWFWFYQMSLCELDGDPNDADRMYAETFEQVQRRAWANVIHGLANHEAPEPPASP